MVTRVAQVYTERFALAHVLLTDGSNVPGLAIRPRFGRVEFCGEFVEGALLEQTCIFAAAAVLACIRVCAGRSRLADFPPAMAVERRGIVQRSGWFIDGVDVEALKRSGRETRIRTIAGDEPAVRTYLYQAWRAARKAIVSHVASADLAPLDGVVDGADRLPFEGVGIAAREAMMSMPRESVFGELLKPRLHPTFALAPVMVTWDVNIFLVSGARTKRAFICIPSVWLESFLTALDAGRLDSYITHCLEARSGRHLVRRRQTNRPGIFRSICPRVELLPPDGSAVV
jgi:hypothetical protein